jgi:Transposase zinc-binding domain
MRYKDPLKQILEQTRWYWDHDGVHRDVRTAFRKVLQCRTPALGAEVFGSEYGELIVYHTCKSRACPSCGHWATMKWQQNRQAALPAVLYRGLTFSMPDALWRVFRNNRRLADALPALAAGAINSLIAAKYQLRSGIIVILHTFNGRLEFNSHVLFPLLSFHVSHRPRRGEQSEGACRINKGRARARMTRRSECQFIFCVCETAIPS